MQTTEVTQGQWKTVMGKNRHSLKMWGKLPGREGVVERLTSIYQQT